MSKSKLPGKAILLSALFFVSMASSAWADSTFVKFGSTWKFLDIGSAAPTGAGVLDWRNVGFNDGSWNGGPAEFGYGENDERTVVSFGPSSASKYMTTYFRRIVNIPNISLFGTVRLNLYVDDGAVIYVNGTEVSRTNMPGGIVAFSTAASGSASEDGNVITSVDIAASNFVSGNNLIAVEVHQSGGTSTDLSFDLEMIAKTGGSPFTFINYGDIWNYLDNGKDSGTTWRTCQAATILPWKSGPSELGYGDGGEATVVDFGPDANNKYITTYFRKTITIANPLDYGSFTLNIKRDDGAVVYVNGVQAAISNITGPVTYTTTAANATDDGNSVFTYTIASTMFSAGQNCIAVELHQNSGSSTDLSFNLELIGNPAAVEPSIERGPMLQMVSGNAVTLKWKTSAAANSRILFGTSENSLTSSLTDNSPVTDHEMRITGLSPDTKYYYAIGTTTSIIKGSYRNYFITTPPANTTRKIRIGVFGDAGTGNSVQKGTRDAYLELKNGNNNSEVVVMLGDNAYNGGFDNEHQTKFFDIYDDNVFDNHVVFPVPGNHEYDNSGTLASNHLIPYYNIFTVPTAAESGGTASGTEHYYSFDYGNIHFIMLDSYGLDGGKPLYDTTGPQAIWLKADLAANAGTHKWTVVCLHHPPYTHGTHNSGSSTSDDETDLNAIREKVNPILERFGVDVVLAGHSHVYERSYLVTNHTGYSGTFVPTAPPAGNLVGGSSAKYDGSVNSCPYFTIDTVARKGTVYVVAGSAGQVGGGSNSKYPVFYYRNYSSVPAGEGEGGSMLLEVQDNRLDAKFVGQSGSVRDQFTIMKGVNKDTTISIIVNTPTTLSASWVGAYNWLPTPPVGQDGARTLNVNLGSTGTYTYYVRDSLTPQTTCISDTFVVQVFASLPVSVIKYDAQLAVNKVLVKWTTEHEFEADYFTIQRSSNGVDFKMIMMLNSRGTPNSKTEYEFQDMYPQEGNNYYRLISTDKNGKTRIIGIRMVVYKPEQALTVTVYPNPAANQEIKGTIQSNKAQQLKIRLFDISGAEVYFKNTSVKSGKNNLKMNVKAGSYILHVETKEGKRIKEKIIVQ